MRKLKSLFVVVVEEEISYFAEVGNLYLRLVLILRAIKNSGLDNAVDFGTHQAEKVSFQRHILI